MKDMNHEITNEEFDVLDECVKALPPCGDHHKAGEALGAKYGNIFGEALLRFFGNDNVSDGNNK